MSVGEATFSFPRARRLDGPHAYAAVFAYKCSANGHWFQIYARPNGVGRARIGVAVSKRIVNTAVARNYCKRLVRDAFRHECPVLPALDFVVRPRVRVKVAEGVTARREVVDLLQRATAQCHSRQATITDR